MAPAGSARRKNGSVAAVWISATYMGPAPSETMSHAAPTPCMNVPTSDAMSAASSRRKIGVRRGRQRLGTSSFRGMCRDEVGLLGLSLSTGKNSTRGNEANLDTRAPSRGSRERFHAISIERCLKHPAIIAITVAGASQGAGLSRHPGP